MALDPLNSSNLEQLALKGLNDVPQSSVSSATCIAASDTRSY